MTATLGTGRIALWSLRYSVANGYHYVKEREVKRDTAARWLSIYQQNESGTQFVVGAATSPPSAATEFAFRNSVL